jgi:hypothetical protein
MRNVEQAIEINQLRSSSELAPVVERERYAANLAAGEIPSDP